MFTRYYLLVFLGCWLPLVGLQAQQLCTISGKVTDGSGIPVPGANVVLKNTNFGVTSDIQGSYTLDAIPVGTYTINVSYVGYQPVNREINLKEGERLKLDFSIEEAPLTLEGLVVTSQRREQAIQDVPVAVTSWEGDFLQSRGIFELDNFSEYVPGLQVQVQSVNNPGFVIRGITSDDGDSRVEPRVSVFQDGVSISKSRGSVVEIFDMERMEVMKGPQGTLFGRGAQIGAVHFIQNKAKNETSGELTLGVGNNGQYLANGYVNVPLADNFYARVSGIYNTREGIIENRSGGKLNGKETAAIRTSLRWLPSTKAVVDLIVNYQKDTPPGTAFKSGTYAPTGGSTDPFSFADMERGEDLFIDRTVWGTTLLVDQILGDRWNLNSITAYRTFDSFESFDADGTAAPALWFAEDAKGDQFSQEFRFNYSDNNRLSGFVGSSFFYEDGSQRVPFETDERSLYTLYSPILRGSIEGDPQLDDPTKQFLLSVIPFEPLVVNGQPNLVSNIPNVAPVFGPLAGAPLKSFHRENFTNYGTNYAIEVFADGTFDVTDKFKVTAGLRGTYENITGGYEVENSETPGNLGFLLGVFPNNLVAPTEGRRDSTATFFSAVGRLALNYEFSEDINFFGSFSRGRRPNVIQVNANSVDVLSDETVWSYEAGVKGLLLNSRLQFDFSGFYYDYNNFQTSIFLLEEGRFLTRDVGKAQATGFELAGRYLASDKLSFFGNYGFIDAKFADEDSDGNEQALAGNRFRLTPEHSFSAGFEVNLPLGDQVSFFLKPTYTYKSQVFFEEENQPGIEQDAYGLLNLFAGFNLFQQRATATFYMNNVLDENYIIDAGNTGGAFGIPTFISGMPRLFGVRLTGRF